MKIPELFNKMQMAKPAAMPAFRGATPAAKSAAPGGDGLSKFQSELRTGQVKPNLNQPAAPGLQKKRLDLFA